MAEPLRNSPFTEEEERLGIGPTGVAPLPPALPGTPPASDEDLIARKRVVRDNYTEDTARSIGETVGNAIGSLRERVRSGLRVVGGKSKRAGDGLDEMADEARDKAEEFADEARERMRVWRYKARQQTYRARRYAQQMARNHPLQALGMIAGSAFAIGFMLRIWRSNSD